MMIQIRQLQRTTERYEFADGVRDIQFALYYLTYGISFLIIFDLPHLYVPALVEFRREQGAVLTTMLICLLIAGPPLLVNAGSLALMNEFVRRRWLWKETGVIKPKQWVVPRHHVLIGLAISLAAFLGGALLAIQTADAWLVLRGLLLGIGLSYAWMLLAVATRLNIPRYRLVGGIGALVTVLVCLLPVTAGMAGLLIGLAWSGLLFISGGFALRQAADRLPPSAPEDAQEVSHGA